MDSLLPLQITASKQKFDVYVYAFLSVTAVFAIRLALHPILLADLPLQPFLLAVAVSAWFWGPKAGIFATVVGLLYGCYFFLIPFYSFSWVKLNHAFFECVILPEGCMLSLFCMYLHKSMNEAKAANKSKSMFLANMSHEIRTPMTSILGFLELIEDPQQTSAQRLEATQAIKRNGEMLIRIIDDVLDLSKVEAGHLQLDCRYFYLAAILQDIQTVFGSNRDPEEVQFQIEMDQSVPEQIYSDPLRLKQILINLIGNAFKFTSKGFIRLRVRVSETRNSPPHLIFEVSDSGIGIPLKARKHVFKPFRQATSEISKNHGGTGLGLMIARKLAIALGGELELVHSDVGIGSLFSVKIPSSPQEKKQQ